VKQVVATLVDEHSEAPPGHLILHTFADDLAYPELHLVATKYESHEAALIPQLQHFPDIILNPDKHFVAVVASVHSSAPPAAQSVHVVALALKYPELQLVTKLAVQTLALVIPQVVQVTTAPLVTK